MALLGLAHRWRFALGLSVVAVWAVFQSAAGPTAPMITNEHSIRLYVGGLPGQITGNQLSDRFAAFGRVSAVELVPGKTHTADLPCRGFAYVNFCPKDDSALHRCLSLVSKCTHFFCQTHFAKHI